MILGEHKSATDWCLGMLVNGCLVPSHGLKSVPLLPLLPLLQIQLQAADKPRGLVADRQVALFCAGPKAEEARNLDQQNQWAPAKPAKAPPSDKETCT